MKNIQLAFAFLLTVISLLWLQADTLIPDPFDYFTFRHVFVQYSGVMGMAMMSVAMLLAVRPVMLERHLRGLDKMYRLHKWLGVSGLFFSVLHWWWVQGTRWMVGWGWLAKPEKRGQSTVVPSGFSQWLHDQRHLAETLGEWAFYLAVLLILVALVKRFPYRLFRQTHKWLAVVYLVLVFHSLVLLDQHYWSHAIAWLMAVLMFSGAVASFWVLGGRVGQKRQYAGVIRSLQYYPGVSTIEGCIDMDRQWPGHQPGQFAFVTSSHAEGAHPYSIASAWDSRDPSLTFIVKKLGDWTRGLDNWLKEGMPVTVEGPYGCFDFESPERTQIWIAAGIGITPFIARMKYLARFPDDREIHLFHSTRDYDEVAISKLSEDARKANVRLYIRHTATEDRFSGEEIRAIVSQWFAASVWFCGPTGFGDGLRRDFLNEGLPDSHFHQELFGMR